MKKTYIAYGSNLNLAQMKYRCPAANLIEVGTIENYTLDFKRLSSQAYATIHPKQGSYVPIAFWEINTTDEKSLDMYEGYPRFYHKRTFTFTLSNGQLKQAMVYIMNSRAIPGIPSPHYIQTIYQGYLDMGFNINTLDEFCRKSGFSLYTMLKSRPPA